MKISPLGVNPINSQNNKNQSFKGGLSWKIPQPKGPFTVDAYKERADKMIGKALSSVVPGEGLSWNVVTEIINGKKRITEIVWKFADKFDSGVRHIVADLNASLRPEQGSVRFTTRG